MNILCEKSHPVGGCVTMEIYAPGRRLYLAPWNGETAETWVLHVEERHLHYHGTLLIAVADTREELAALVRERYLEGTRGILTSFDAFCAGKNADSNLFATMMRGRHMPGSQKGE